MSLAEDLQDARALIDTPDKWCRGVLWNDAGARCAMGACNVAAGPNDNMECEQMLYALEKQLPLPWNHIAEFNDDENTTHQDMMALFDRAILAAMLGHRSRD